MSRYTIKKVIVIFILLYSGCSIGSEAVKVGLASKPTTLDPHIWLSQENWTVHFNTYSLLGFDTSESSDYPEFSSSPNSSLNKKGIIKAVDVLDNGKISLKIFRNIKFHDGSELKADDVIHSIERIKKLGDKSSFQSNIVNVKGLEKVDDYTINIESDIGVQSLLFKFRQVFIIKKTSNDLIIGSGFYKVLSGDNLSEIQLELFDESLKDKYVNRANLIYTSSSEERAEKLLSGELDIVENITYKDVEVLKNKGDFNFTYVDSPRLIYLAPDQYRDVSPFVKSFDGKHSLKQNPLKDKRVRKAISLGLDRDYLTKVILGGAGLPTGQYMLPDSKDYIERIGVDPYDPEAAKKLLADAGYSDGFSLVLHAPNNRYLKDKEIAKEAGKMLDKIGIKVEVRDLPKKEFFKAAFAGEYSLALSGWASQSQENFINNLFASYSEEKEVGKYNIGRYSNLLIDQVLDEVQKTNVYSEKRRLAKQAIMFAISDMAIIPLHFQKRVWASNKDYRFTAKPNSSTILLNIEK